MRIISSIQKLFFPMLSRQKRVEDPDLEQEEEEAGEEEEEVDEYADPEPINHYPGTQGFVDPRELGATISPSDYEEVEEIEELEPFPGSYWYFQREVWDRIPDPGSKKPRATRE